MSYNVFASFWYQTIQFSKWVETFALFLEDTGRIAISSSLNSHWCRVGFTGEIIPTCFLWFSLLEGLNYESNSLTDIWLFLFLFSQVSFNSSCLSRHYSILNKLQNLWTVTSCSWDPIFLTVFVCLVMNSILCAKYW
jgi:hypothetical protein